MLASLSGAWALVKGASAGFYAYCLWHTINRHLLTCTLCYGDSMYPAINSRASSSDVVLVECLSKKFSNLKRNDIIVARQPDEPSTIICKRITALEGDDIPLGVINPCKYTIIPRGHVWVEGDNTAVSYDSRRFGPLPYGLIRGRVVFRIWPPSQFGRIH